MNHSFFKSFLTYFIITISLISCKDEVLPKPSSQLRLDYPVAKYIDVDKNCPFSFSINTKADIKEDPNCGFTISYPKMKATIYLTYKPVNGNINNLLKDAQNLTYKLHTLKADEIIEQPFINGNNKVYGMFYKVGGNAATNAQFYVTDSLRHFITGSVYFYAKPNFDSIMPAASYIENDMQNMIETIRWK
jgi:gliding motility-associated lipoprotein GldD